MADRQLAITYNHKPGETFNLLNNLYVKHLFNILLINLGYEPGVSKISLLLGFFLSKDVAFESMLSFNFAGSR